MVKILPEIYLKRVFLRRASNCAYIIASCTCVRSLTKSFCDDNVLLVLSQLWMADWFSNFYEKWLKQYWIYWFLSKYFKVYWNHYSIGSISYNKLNFIRLLLEIAFFKSVDDCIRILSADPLTKLASLCFGLLVWQIRYVDIKSFRGEAKSEQKCMQLSHYYALTSSCRHL